MCSQQPIIYSSTTLHSAPTSANLSSTISLSTIEPLLWIPFQSASPLLYNYRLGILLTLPTSPLTDVAYACKYLILPLSFTSSLWKQIALSFHHLFFNNYYWNMFEQPYGPLPPQSTLFIFLTATRMILFLPPSILASLHICCFS